MTDKEAQIVAAARALLLERGFRGVTIEAVAAHAQVAKQTVYNHFQGLAAIFAAVVEDTLARVGRQLADTIHALDDDPSDLEATLVELGERWLEIFLDDEARALRQLVFSDPQAHPQMVAMWLDGGPRRATSELAGYLARLAVLGRLDLDDPGVAAEQLRTLFTAGAWRGPQAGDLAGEAGSPDASYIRDHVRFFLRAYGSPAAEAT